MNQRFWNYLPAAVLTTVLGTTSFTYAQPISAVDQNSETSPTAEISGEPQQAEQGNSQLPTLAKGFKRGRRSSSGGGGMASWYGSDFHGRRSASGEIYNQNTLTAAHRSLPFGTRVRVTNVHNNRSVVVRINDRGPFIGGRVIDLSTAAARNLGMMGSGVAPVRIQVVGR